MNDKPASPSLSEAEERFLLTLPEGERIPGRRELHRFVRWFGAQHALSGLTGVDVELYTGRIALSRADNAGSLDYIRAFLAYVRARGWTRTNLAVNIKVKKDNRRKKPAPRSARNQPEVNVLSRQGYADLEAELAALKSKRPELIDEIQRAAADKDFRENVPLHAAREARGHLEGRILELEEMLKSAVIMEEQKKSARLVNVGDTIVLHHLDSGEERRYRLVSPREVDPARGMISSVSPIGRAVINREQGETVEVVAPAGRVRYRITQVEH